MLMFSGYECLCSHVVRLCSLLSGYVLRIGMVMFQVMFIS
jgi:hypothetical protein